MDLTPQQREELDAIMAALDDPQQMGAVRDELDGAIREAVSLIGYDPDSETGQRIVDGVIHVFRFEDVEDGTLERLALAVAVGVGEKIDTEPWTCWPG